jgi:TPR repeat protein
VEYYKLSEDQGNRNAHCGYGLCCFGDLGISAGDFKAVNYFWMAARSNVSSADYYFGICLFVGFGFCVDFEASEDFYQPPIRKGFEKAGLQELFKASAVLFF